MSRRICYWEHYPFHVMITLWMTESRDRTRQNNIRRCPWKSHVCVSYPFKLWSLRIEGGGGGWWVWCMCSQTGGVSAPQKCPTIINCWMYRKSQSWRLKLLSWRRKSGFLNWAMLCQIKPLLQTWFIILLPYQNYVNWYVFYQIVWLYSKPFIDNCVYSCYVSIN